MDERWNTHVRPIFRVLVEILLPVALLDGLFGAFLISEDEYDKIKTYTNRKGSRKLLLDILPRKGPDSFDRFLSVLKETEGQKHVAKKIMGEGEKHDGKRAVGKNKEIEKIRELKRALKEEKEEKNKERVTNIGLRNKFSMGNSSLKWETNIPNMPIGCYPYGRVAEINGMLHVGDGNRMLQFKNEAWEGEKHHLPGIQKIWSVFECQGKGYVMGINEWSQCSSIYEWQSESRNLKLLTKIPDEYQLEFRSAIGHNGNIYLVGGEGSDRVDCFDINKEEWKSIKKMKNERYKCSLAVIDDKMFVGGGRGAGNLLECFSMEKQDWIDIKPTTNRLCELSSWNGKLVATGAWGWSNCVEMYDELSGDWLPLPSMNERRWGHGACTTKDNQLIVVGGSWGIGTSIECLKM